VYVPIFVILWIASFALAASRSVPKSVPFLCPLAFAAMFVIAWNADAHSNTGDSQGHLIATVGIWFVAFSLILVFLGLAVRSRRSRP
jgi:hypothetical protein